MNQKERTMGIIPKDLSTTINSIVLESEVSQAYYRTQIPLDNKRREILTDFFQSDTIAQSHCLTNCRRFPDPKLAEYCIKKRCHLS